jgi:hypothetical protein
MLTLRNWLNLETGKMSITSDAVSYTYTAPPSLRIDLPNDEKLALEYGTVSTKAPFEIIFNHDVALRLIFKEAVTFIYILEKLDSLSAIFSLLLGEEIKLYDYSMETIKLKKGPRETGPIDWEEYSRAYFAGSDPEEKHFTTFNIHYSEIKDEFPRILYNWMETVEPKLKPIINILLDSLKLKKEFNEADFLSVCQGVEAFHRIVLQDTKNLKAEFQTFLDKEILANINDENNKRWLKENLWSRYEPSAKSRLISLFIANPIFLVENFTKERAEIWTREIINSRNYLVHLDPDQKKKLVEPQKLVAYTNLLKKLLLIEILKYTGVTSVAIAPLSARYGVNSPYLP